MRNNHYSRALLATAAFVLAALPIAAWTSQEHPNRIDRYLFEHMGQTLLDGGVVYLDCWDNKPPGMAWFNALVLGLGGRSTYAVTAAAVLAGLLAVGVTWRAVARQLGGATGMATAALFALILAQRRFDALTNGTEFYAMVADAFAAVFAMRVFAQAPGTGVGATSAVQSGERSEPARFRRFDVSTFRRFSPAFAAGAAWGVAMLFKQTGAAGPVSVAACTAIGVLADPRRRGYWLASALAVGAGALAVLLPATAVLWWQGALGEAWYAVIGINLLEDTGLSSRSFLSAVLLRQIDLLEGALLLAATGAVLAIVTMRRGAGVKAASLNGTRSEADAPSPAVLPLPAIVFLLVWLAAAVYGISVGASHMPRYWHGAFVPLMWLAAQGVAFALALCGSGAGRAQWTARIGAAVLVFVFFKPLAMNVFEDGLRAYHYATADSERAELQDIGRRVAELSAPDDYIYVVGYCPGIYRFSGRRCASRFAGNEKLGTPSAFGQAMADDIFDALKRREPKVLLIEADRHDTVRADRIGAFTVPGLAAWLDDHYAVYTPDRPMLRFHVLVRKPS